MADILTEREKKILLSVGKILFPPAPSISGVSEEKLMKEIERILAILEPRNQWILRFLFSTFEYSSLFSHHLRPFSRLSESLQREYLKKCLKGGVRQNLFQISKAFVGLSYLSMEETLKKIGDDGRPFKWPASPLPPPTSLATIGYPEINRDIEIGADVVIVGSGAGGATVASALSKAGLAVVVVEEGGTIERSALERKASHRLFKFYRENGMYATFGLPVIPIITGKMVGGTTVINAGSCFRTPPFVLESWVRDLKIQGVSPKDMEPLFLEIEERLHIQPVSDDIMGKNGAILRRGAEALGVSGGPIRRPMRDCHGTGECAFICPRDAKLDMRLTYLPEAVSQGCRIYSRCQVMKILQKDGKAVGVQALIEDELGKKSGYTLTVRAKAVVLSAGALQTPYLLLKNRIGNKRVGKNLHIHPAYAVGALFDEDVYGWKGVMQSYYIDEWMKKGFTIETNFTPPGISYTSGFVPSLGSEHHEYIARFRQMAEIGFLLSDTSSGRVRAGWDGRPWSFYFLNKRDTQASLEGIYRTCQVLFAAGAKEVYLRLPGMEILTDPRQIEKIPSLPIKARDLTFGAFHPMGSCSIGEDPKNSATDSFGKVHGIEGLYIADASLIPTSIHVNPQITLMALSVRVARRILDEWQNI